MTKPNRAMELYRFAAAVMILCYHCYWFAFREDGTQFIGYYLFVELFFILSGFLMMRSIRRNVTPEHRLDAANTTVRYIGNRLRAFYPHHLLSLALVFFIEAFLRKSMFPIELAEAAWPELFLVNIFGFVRGGYVNIVCWYLSALLFSSVIIYYWLLKDEEGFVKIAAPVILVIFYGCLFDRKGSFATTIIFTRYSAPLGFMRAVADMTAGVLTYRVFDYGRPRELHVEKALDVTVTAPPARPYGAIGETVAVEGGSVRPLAACELFTVELRCAEDAMQMGAADSFAALLLLDGEADVTADGETVHMTKGQSALLPVGVTVRVTGGTWLYTEKGRAVC